MRTAVIFDLDGTLLNTLDDLHASVNNTLEKFGYPQRSLPEVRSFVGNGVPMLIRRALPADASEEDFCNALEYFKEYYKVHCDDRTKPYPGICEALAQLKTDGYPIGVVTNKVDNATKILCEKHFGELVDIALGQNGQFQVKPDPESLFYVKKYLCAETVIYVGDSEVDILTAENAGARCVSVSWGFKDREFLLAAGAQIIADTPKQMTDCIYNILNGVL